MTGVRVTREAEAVVGRELEDDEHGVVRGSVPSGASKARR